MSYYTGFLSTCTHAHMRLLKHALQHIHTHLPTHTYTHTHKPQLADGVWLVKGDEAHLVALVGTYITGGDGTEGSDVNERSYERKGGEGEASINHIRELRTWSQDTCHRAKDGRIQFTWHTTLRWTTLQMNP